MATRKSRYYTHKRKKIQLTTAGCQSIFFHNRIRSLKCGPKKINYRQGSQRWLTKRCLTIPSSLVKKAVSCNGNYLDYYETFDYYSLGAAIAESLLNIFNKYVSKVY